MDLRARRAEGYVRTSKVVLRVLENPTNPMYGNWVDIFKDLNYNSYSATFCPNTSQPVCYSDICHFEILGTIPWRLSVVSMWFCLANSDGRSSLKGGKRLYTCIHMDKI